MAPLRCLISGGGVAGTSLAFWLSKLGHDVTVVEQYPSLRTTGLQIDIRGHGIEVLRRMGLEPGFRERAAPEEGLQFVDSNGCNRAYMGANKTGKGSQSFTSDFEIMRGDLCRLIHDGTHGRARYIYGTSVDTYKQDGNGVSVTLKNGKTEHYDFWVGADGAHSATRKMVLGAEASDAAFHSLHENNAYMTFRSKMAEGERYVAQMYPAPGHRMVLVRRHSPDEKQLYLLLPGDDERLLKVKRGDVPAEKAAFAEIFAGLGWQTPALLEEMHKADDFYCERLGLVKLDQWVHGRIAFLGDSASSPGGSGMGTTSAMVGAYVLAGEIGRRCGRGDDASSSDDKDGSKAGALDAALASYDKTFRPFVTEVQKGVDSSHGNWMPTSDFGLNVMHSLLWALMFLKIDKLVMWMFQGGSETYPLPDYAELREAQARDEAEFAKKA